MFNTIAPLPDFSSSFPFLSISVLVPKLDCYSVFLPREKLFAKAIFKFLLPLLGQESGDGGTAIKESRSVAPDGVRGVSHGYSFWVSACAVSQRVKHGDAQDGGWYLVFQRSCAALTLARAVSSVNGGAKLAIDLYSHNQLRVRSSDKGEKSSARVLGQYIATAVSHRG